MNEKQPTKTRRARTGASSTKSAEEIGAVAAIIATLPDRWQTPFVMRVIDGRAYRLIGESTGISWHTILHWSQRAEWKAASTQLRTLLAKLRIENWQSLQLLADERLLEVLDGEAKVSATDRLRAIEMVLDRSGLPKGAQVVEAAGDEAPTPHTPAGRAALIEEVSGLPPDLLREALARALASVPAHLRETT